MMRIRMTIPEGQVDEKTINSALETATVLAQRQVPTVPRIQDAIRTGQVKWAPEPPGDENFDLPNTVMKRGWGDCDDLAPWLTGQLRATGEDPGAKTIAKRTGPTQWHALTLRSNGAIQDPSKWAGMPSRAEGTHVFPFSKPLVGVGKAGLAMSCCGGPAYRARVDLPMIGKRVGLAIGASDKEGMRALRKTILGASIIGEYLNKRRVAGIVDPRAVGMCGALDRVFAGQNVDHVCGASGLDPAQVRQFIQMARTALATAADELFRGGTYTARSPIEAAYKTPYDPPQPVMGGRG